MSNLKKQTGLALPKITIVTPTLNQGPFLEQCIQSVLDQSYPNLEFIVMDGGSTDQTLDILKKYSAHLTFWESKPDKGQSHAINKGLKRGSGQIFNWLNSDDFLVPDALKFIGEEFQKSPFLALCGRVNVWDDKEFSHVRKPSYIGASLAESIGDFNINQEGTWWNYDVLRSIGGVDEQLHYCMDVDLWFRFLLHPSSLKVREVPTILSNFRRHNHAKSTLANSEDYFNSHFFKESTLIFDGLLPPSKSWSYSEFSADPFFSHGKKPMGYSASARLRNEIMHIRLLKLSRLAFDMNQIHKASQILDKVSLFYFGRFYKDINYLRRIILKERIWRIGKPLRQ